MCGRFTLRSDPRQIAEAFDLDPASLPELPARYNIAPTQQVAVVRRSDGTGPRELAAARWGLVPRWVDDPSDWPTLINARSETAAEKPAFREAFRRRRCLVPASNFYEWTGRRGQRIPHCIRVDDRELFAMAGLWETWSDDGDEVRSATILTTEANDVVDDLHDRMPVILAPDEEPIWLEADDVDELNALLDPYPGNQTRSYEVSRAVNDPTNEGPELVEPVGGGQSGLGDFA